MDLSSAHYSNIPNIPYCNYISIEDFWKCSVCGTTIPKSMVAEKPLSACRIGSQIAGRKDFRQIAFVKKDLSDSRIPMYQMPGPGTELKKLLKSIGITQPPDYSFNQKVVAMNNWGPRVCEYKIETILGWLKEEADKQKITYIHNLAHLLVKKAIRNARKKL